MNQPNTRSNGPHAGTSETPARLAESQVIAGIRYFGTVLSDPTASAEEIRQAYHGLVALRQRRDDARRRDAMRELGRLAADARTRRATILAEFSALLARPVR